MAHTIQTWNQHTDFHPSRQAIFSWIVYGGGAAMEIWAPQHFYRVGSLVSQILAVIFWLTAWAWSADTASAWIKASDLYIYKGSNPLKSFGGALAGCAAIGAVAWSVLTRFDG